MSNKLRKGFTLIELLLVVIIIGIVAAIALPRFQDAKNMAYKATAASDLRNLITAMELAFNTSSAYPAVNCINGTACAGLATYTPSPDVRIITYSGLSPKLGYAASASHQKLENADNRCINIGQQSGSAGQEPNLSGLDFSKASGAQYTCASRY